MTRDKRTAVRMALNTAKRAWLESQGGYKKVEADAAGLDRRVRETCHGTRAKYLAGCRCQACHEAEKQYGREWARARRPVVDQDAKAELGRLGALKRWAAA